MFGASPPDVEYRYFCLRYLIYTRNHCKHSLGSPLFFPSIPPIQVQCMHVAEQGQTLLVAGSESTLTSLSRSQLERKARTPVTPRSVYALALNDGTGPHEGVRTQCITPPFRFVCFNAPQAFSDHGQYEEDCIVR